MTSLIRCLQKFTVNSQFLFPTKADKNAATENKFSNNQDFAKIKDIFLQQLRSLSESISSDKLSANNETMLSSALSLGLCCTTNVKVFLKELILL